MASILPAVAAAALAVERQARGGAGPGARGEAPPAEQQVEREPPREVRPARVLPEAQRPAPRLEERVDRRRARIVRARAGARRQLEDEPEVEPGVGRDEPRDDAGSGQPLHLR